MRTSAAESDSPESDFGSIKTSNRNVTHVLGTVASTATGIQLKITKQDVQDLPPVDIDHPGLSAGGRSGRAYPARSPPRSVQKKDL